MNNVHITHVQEGSAVKLSRVIFLNAGENQLEGPL